MIFKLRPTYLLQIATFLILCFLMIIVLPVKGTSKVCALDRFVSGVVDLPLMVGLEEIPGSVVVFSKAQGRIIDVTAHGPVTPKMAQRFYERTLPQLGWKKQNLGIWRRESETLRINFELASGQLVVRFSITPE